MKKQITYVAFAQIETLVKAEGLTMLQGAAFMRINDPRNENRRVYIAKTKEVGRVDISGYEPKAPGVIPLTKDEAKAKRIGNVRGQLDFTKPSTEVMANLALVLKELKGEDIGPKDNLPSAADLLAHDEDSLEA